MTKYEKEKETPSRRTELRCHWADCQWGPNCVHAEPVEITDDPRDFSEHEAFRMDAP